MYSRPEISHDCAVNFHSYIAPMLYIQKCHLALNQEFPCGKNSNDNNLEHYIRYYQRWCVMRFRKQWLCSHRIQWLKSNHKSLSVICSCVMCSSHSQILYSLSFSTSFVCLFLLPASHTNLSLLSTQFLYICHILSSCLIYSCSRHHKQPREDMSWGAEEFALLCPRIWR